MEGFFSKKETQSISRPDGKTYSCASCGLHKGCDTPKMKVSGDFNKGILNIGAIPSRKEDSAGHSFVDNKNRYIEKIYKSVGIDLFDDCFNTYAIQCYSDKIPISYQADCCRKNILNTIKKYKPKVIVLFGDIALYSVIGNRWKKDLGKIDKWQGFTIPDQELNAWIVPTFSPDFVLDSKRDVEEVIWKKDLQKIADLVDTPLPVYKEPEIIYLEDDLGVLDTIKVGNIAFDYETTGLKPHAKDHRIICASVAVNKDKVYAFMLPDTRRKREPFTDLLQRKSVGKIAQNMKYEDTWTTVRLKIPVNNWLWDTMLASHIIDNRRGITGLKFQTYIRFGIIDYDSEISPYLKAIDNKNANALNRINDLIKKPGGGQDLLKYCALDSVYEYRLALFQRKHIAKTQGRTPLSPINSDYPNAYKLLHKGILALAKAERQGLRIDVEYAEKKKIKLTKQIERLEKKFFASKFYRHWAHTTKSKPNLNSGTQLGNFLYGIKKIEPAKLTKTGKGSTDEEALSLLNIPELNWLLDRSKLQKIRDTYLDAFVREQVKGYLHPFFNLHLVETYRSSSSNPNFQNIPKRDKTAMKIVRKAIYPRPGYQLLEMDYSGIEVAIAACYHKDKNMLKYITDPTSDMHGDMAKQIFMIDNWDRTIPEHSMLRDAAKNGFVFPQFYGDYYKNNADGISSAWIKMPHGRWTDSMGIKLEDGTPIGKHLRSKGIKSQDDFIQHIQRIEKNFWKKRFPDYAKWKDRHYETYLENGYISLKTGFTCGGAMSRNEVINYPVQGAAFHCLLWPFIEITEELKRREFKTKLVGQIHDAIIVDVYPPELIEVYNLIQEIGTVKLKEVFPWIIVPLSIDAELCPVDGSWADKEKWEPSIEELPIYYYYHAESDSLWSSTNNFEKEGNPDGCTEEIDLKDAKKIAKKLNMEFDKDGFVQDDIPF